MSTLDWDVTLDEFERRLAAQWTALQQSSLDEVTPFQPPQVTTPVPPELSARAIELVHRCRALEDALAAAMAKVTGQLERAAAGTAPPAQPVYFDSRI